MAGLETSFAQLSVEHGACHPEGQIKARNRSEARWGLACDRGGIQFIAALTPTVPPRVQLLSWTEEFPPDERLQEVATNLTGAIGQSPQRLSADVFAATAAGGQARRNLAHLSVEHADCHVERPLTSNGRDHAMFRLQCKQRSFDLSFAIDEPAGKVTEVLGRPPPDPDGVCVQ
jgi:hypothetical protein